jgi:formylglycine-generating enzyme required for sulfatase activity
VALKGDGKTLSAADRSRVGIRGKRGSNDALLVGKGTGCGARTVRGMRRSESGKTVPSGSFRANAFGLYDTAGNAAEWVEDCWNPTYRGAPKDGSAWTNGDCSLRVLRGGSFADKALAVRSSARFRYDEDVRYYANGFRVARDLN